jgi:hypothetical protein
MLSSAAPKSASLTDTQAVTRKTGSIVTRKVWIPKFFYDALPYFYLTAGFAAFFATLYISEWFWVLPHYLLFSAACLHLGVLVLRRRRRTNPDEIYDQDAPGNA